MCRCRQVYHKAIGVYLIFYRFYWEYSSNIVKINKLDFLKNPWYMLVSCTKINLENKIKTHFHIERQKRQKSYIICRDFRKKTKTSHWNIKQCNNVTGLSARVIFINALKLNRYLWNGLSYCIFAPLINVIVLYS